jgi:hypothetical protein
VDIQILSPEYTVVGSAGDKDAKDGPGKSYGPKNQNADSVADGTTTADSTCTSETELSVTAVAETTKNSKGTAYANAKAMAKSKLVISYSKHDARKAAAGDKPEIELRVKIDFVASVSDGPCGGSFAVFINGPGGPTSVLSWSQTYSFVRDPADSKQLLATRTGGNTVTIANPGSISDDLWPPGWHHPPNQNPSLPIDEGTYDLTFEVNAVTIADGSVSLAVTGKLHIDEA